MPDTGGAVLDFSYLAAQTGGDAALQAELLVLFAGQCDRLLPLLLAGGAGDARAEAAHALRGGALAIGAGTLAAILKEIEEAPDPSDAATRSERLVDAVAAVRTVIGDAAGRIRLANPSSMG